MLKSCPLLNKKYVQCFDALRFFIQGKKMQLAAQVTSTEVFSAAALLYARMRRVNSRVIDVMYLVENKQYAQHVLTLAQEAKDDELDRLSVRLQRLMNLDLHESQIDTHETVSAADEQDDRLGYEATPEEVYKAQVQHHYIGALR